MLRMIRIAFGTSFALTAALLATWGVLSASTSNLPIEWAGVGFTEPADPVSAVELARN